MNVAKEPKLNLITHLIVTVLDRHNMILKPIVSEINTKEKKKV
jgi:hypothetical protein